MQQEVGFDIVSNWCDGPYWCASVEQLLSQTLSATGALLLLASPVLRVLLPVIREPRDLAEHIVVPPHLTTTYLRSVAGVSLVSLLWALSALVELPRGDAMDFAMGFGRLAWLSQLFTAFACGLTLVGQIAVIKYRRAFGDGEPPDSDRPSWIVVRALAFGAGLFLAAQAGLLALAGIFTWLSH